MSSMFDGLYIARNGVHSAQIALNTTGHNITNANTEGYTRQRVDQNSIPPAEYGGQWSTIGAVVGNGSKVDSIEQLRDEFLDFAFRTQNSKSGESSTQVNTLYDMEDIFTTTTTADSSSKSSVIDVLNNEFSNFLSQLQNLTSSNSNVSESNVRDAADSLAKKMNIAAKALETTREQQFIDLNKYDLNDANSLLKNIASLNKEIKDAETSGESVLELKDERNLKLDKLSKYVPINVTETPEKLPSGRTVNTMSVYLADPDGNKLVVKNPSDPSKSESFQLIGGTDGTDFAEFTVSQDGNNEAGSHSGKPYDITHIRLSGLSTDGGKTFGAQTDMKNDNIEGGTFSGYLKLLNESGEYDTAVGGTTNTFRGIGYYSQFLDTLAQNLASTLNTLNSKNNPPTDNNAEALLTGGTSVSDVTAANIHVAGVWTDGHLLKSKAPVNASDKNGGSFSNILAMISKLTTEKCSLNTKADGSGITVFTGSMQAAFADESGALARGANSLQSTDNTNSSLLSSINDSRQQLSSVSLDDEAVSIVQYSQSLNASSRFMTAVDECLQTIINGMGLAGRG